MRWRKLFIFLLLAGIPVIDAIFLGWSVANDETADIVVYALSLAFSIYVLVLTVRSINQNITSSHSEFVLHLTTLTTLASVSLGSTALIPATSPTSKVVEGAPALRPLWYAKLSLYTAVCVMAFITQQGPRLRFPPDRIYSEKTILATTNTEEENVCGISGKA
jgi:hypothetical protein